MGSERFYCTECKRYFDETAFYEERHGLNAPPYERVAICPHCKSTDFEKIEILIDKFEMMEALLPALMYINRYMNSIRDVFGLNINNNDLNDAVDIIVEKICEMYDFLESDIQSELFDMSTEYDLEKMLMRFNG